MYTSAEHAQLSKQLHELTSEIRSCFTLRKDALTTVMLANVASAGNTHCVSHLSLETPNYTHDGLLSGLNHGNIDTAKLTQVLYKHAKTRSGFKHVYTIDQTSWMRLHAKTVEDKMMVRDSQSANRGLAADAGWSYSLLAAQTNDGITPLSFERVKPDDELHEFTVQQMKNIVDLDPDVTHLLVGDAGYSATTLTLKVREMGLPVTILTRLATNRVYWKDVPDDAPPKKGVKQKHGEKLVLKNPNQGPVPDQVNSFTYDAKIVKVRCWNGFHQNLKKQHSATKGRSDRPVVSGNVLYFQTEGKSTGLWLWYSGNATEMKPEELYVYYVKRFDIEHGFRFMKQTLGLTRFHTVSTKAADTWIALAFGAYVLVTGLKKYVKPKRLRWERNKGNVTLKMVARGLSEQVLALLRKVGVRINKNCGVGWPKGTRRIARKEQKTVVKHPEMNGSARKYT